MTDDASRTDKDERARLVESIQAVQVDIERAMLAEAMGPLVSTSLTMPQLKILGLIVMRGETTSLDLVRTLQVSGATVSGLVDRLVERGVVTRREDIADRRVKHLEPTAEGRSLVASLFSVASILPDELFHLLDTDDLRALARGVEALSRAASEHTVRLNGPLPVQGD